ncbi:MAG TPA: ArsR family transcriptional regulator [Candidatus Nanoarchaeia archaeon]|nr:ArsR family transcriptional regulator [Candidatus Nanoarchaeia archaeon]
MEIDSFLTLPRWRILEILSAQPSSPIEISAKINTSTAYVSQQLKLLEAANIVKKHKTGAADKGKPRVVFSIAKDIVYLTILSDKFSTKKVISIDEKNKVILRIWLVDDVHLRHSLEKAYWLVEKNLDDIQAIYLDQSGKKPVFVILTESDKLKAKLNLIFKEGAEDLDISIKNPESWKRSENLIVLYESNSSMNEIKMKGGIAK